MERDEESRTIDCEIGEMNQSYRDERRERDELHNGYE